jgi:succinoglycan biosynthesis transport protein ExoP
MSTELALQTIEQEPQPSSLNFSDLLFILFRHKWKIVLCAALGVIAAAVAYFSIPPLYDCQAKLLVRYVVEKSALDGLDSSVQTPGSEGAVLINSEVAILTSWDVVAEVVDAIGVKRLLGASQSKEPRADAVRGVLGNLRVSAVKESNIISLSYKNKDPELAVQVLKELLSRYFDKHLEFHRSTGGFDYVKQEAAQQQARLSQTEKELKQLTDRVGIISTAVNAASLNDGLVKGEQEFSATEAEFEAQQARVATIEQGLAWAQTDASAKDATQQVDSEIIKQYQALIGRVANLRQAETELLSKYTPQNRLVKIKHAQIEDLENQCRNLERKHPGLLETVPAAVTSQTARRDLVTEKARLEELRAKAEALKSRVTDLRARVKTFSEIGPQLAELQRKKEVEEASYKYYESSLEKARIDETLSSSKMPNISVVQKPLTAEKNNDDKKKIVLVLAFAGGMVGLAIAALIDLVLDRSVKRPLELETRLSIPLLLSVPDFSQNGHSRPRLLNAGQEQLTAFEEGARRSPVPWEDNHFIRPFCDAIRDRLIFDFETKRMSQKPKLVGVTGLSKNAGTSTLAAGLAATLSESSDGRVLLVDEPVAPKKFYSMMTDLKASDLEYVVFDMPSLGETSSTLPLAGFMDKVLLIVEAEKSNRDTVKRAYTRLSAKADVSVIFNKSRTYVPKWLDDEI